MKIVIAGAGEVGSHLARLLSNQAQDIILIDRNAAQLETALAHFDVITIEGDATSIRTLRDADVKNADLMIAVTSSEETNIIVATLAKRMGAKKTLARIRKSEYMIPSIRKDLENIGIDTLFSPRDLAAAEICRLVTETGLSEMQVFEKGELRVIGVTVRDSMFLAGKNLNELNVSDQPPQLKTIAIQRNDQAIQLSGDTSLKVNDHVYFVATPEGMEFIRSMCTKNKSKIKNIMITGGSSVGYRTAALLEKNYKVKLIEKDREKCIRLAEELNHCLILNGSASDVEFLEEEGLSEMDAFIALTGDTEKNIISSLVAKVHNVRRTIALVENMDYINIAQRIGVDTLINRKLIVANEIVKYVRPGYVKAMMRLPDMEGEVIEYEVLQGSSLARRPINDISLPTDVTIAGVIKGSTGIIAHDGVILEEGDNVIVYAMPKAVSALEELFS
jgi:trk system potassium uptake protein TrkA